ncbi:DUF3306 domain-containing protein [Phreatobacter cathodiphilus]|uniref:DUF3306 domain-containing protein n=1 Tax=Phreatobacter cathodiphilus TaxID=1868589 RepID=A0A2S0NFR2_9HYPH|nr:DUF3306 domain-containing protein [Phreatobacter cathodiphilus]AVO46995.1 hypothetical protein C6569_19120 [Phreatobacter cathodiphilus]
MSGADKGFLSRWSRLKRQPAPAPEPPAPAAEPAAAPLPEGQALDDLLAQLPRIEDLVPGQSLSAFMQPWVPTGIRNAALQRMWLLDPAIRDYVSPALDYAYDYNTPGGAPGFGPMETGRDAIREVAEMFDRALGKAPEADAATAAGEHDNVSQSGSANAPADAAMQQSFPGTAVVRTEVSGASEKTSGKAQEIGGEDAKAPAAVHKSASETKDLRPVGRRHGGALPG